METLVAIAVIGAFCALLGFLIHLEYTRHKLWVTKEREQISLYRKLYQKLDNM